MELPEAELPEDAAGGEEGDDAADADGVAGVDGVQDAALPGGDLFCEGGGFGI